MSRRAVESVRLDEEYEVPIDRHHDRELFERLYYLCHCHRASCLLIFFPMGNARSNDERHRKTAQNRATVTFATSSPRP